MGSTCRRFASPRGKPGGFVDVVLGDGKIARNFAFRSLKKTFDWSKVSRDVLVVVLDMCLLFVVCLLYLFHTCAYLNGVLIFFNQQ